MKADGAGGRPWAKARGPLLPHPRCVPASVLSPPPESVLAHRNPARWEELDPVLKTWGSLRGDAARPRSQRPRGRAGILSQVCRSPKPAHGSATHLARGGGGVGGDRHTGAVW